MASFVEIGGEETQRLHMPTTKIWKQSRLNILIL